MPESHDQRFGLKHFQDACFRFFDFEGQLTAQSCSVLICIADRNGFISDLADWLINGKLETRRYGKFGGPIVVSMHPMMLKFVDPKK